MRVVIPVLLFMSLHISHKNHYLHTTYTRKMSDTIPKNTKVTNKVNQPVPLTVSRAAADNNIVPGSSPDTLSASYSKTATTLKIKKHVPGTSRDTIVTKTVPGTIKITGKHKPGSKP